ncbi:hypothetical protein Tco_1089674 [Tanacetum coccineum]
MANTTSTSLESSSSNSVWKEDNTFLSWLEKHPPKSVVYVSIGSLATMTVSELLKIWHGLVNSGKPFLWVRRPGSITGGYDKAKFSTGHAFWHDRAVCHELEQFSSELNNISLIEDSLEESLGAFGKSQTYRDKEVNMARDSDDALVFCIENTVEDYIMDPGASFHATNYKEELERFKLRSSKDVRIGMNMLASKGNVPDVRKVDIYFCKPGGLRKHRKQRKLSFMMSEKTRKLQSRSCGSDSDEMRYSFWDTKSHQVIRSRDITFVDSIYGARSATNSSSLTKPIQKSQVVLVDIPKNLAENDSIVAEHGLSLEITQSLGGSSNTSEGSENSGSFEDSGRSDEEYFEDGASSKEGGFETPHVRRSTRESRAPVRYSPSTNYLLHTENGEPKSYSEALSSKESIQWKKNIIEEMVKEEQDVSKRYKARLVVKGFQQIQGEPSYVGALNDTYTQHKIKGFQLAGQKENLECRLKEIMYGLIQTLRLRYLKFDSFMQKDKMKDRCSEKQVLGYVLTVGITTVEWESGLQKPCRDVHQVGDEREVKVLPSFNQPSSELITEDGVLPEKGYSQFNDVSSRYLVSKVS